MRLELSDRSVTVSAGQYREQHEPTFTPQNTLTIRRITVVKTASTMLPLGTAAPDFTLQNIDGSTVSRDQFAGKPLLVIFMCNHCPFVVYIREALAKFTTEYLEQGLAIVGISSNDVEKYPQDGPDKMVEEAADAGYKFPYLLDATQDVAKAYKAACTPDFFLFDADHALVYRGQFDSSRPSLDTPVTGADLRKACDLVLAGESVPGEQTPSLGCNIKWVAGQEPEYFTGQSAE
jgi:peroxiredoxin